MDGFPSENAYQKSEKCVSCFSLKVSELFGVLWMHLGEWEHEACGLGSFNELQSVAVAQSCCECVKHNVINSLYSHANRITGMHFSRSSSNQLQQYQHRTCRVNIGRIDASGHIYHTKRCLHVRWSGYPWIVKCPLMAVEHSSWICSRNTNIYELTLARSILDQWSRITNSWWSNA